PPGLLRQPARRPSRGRRAGSVTSVVDGTPHAAADVVRLGTRKSVLARTQSGHVAERLEASLGHGVDLVPITTEGDVRTGPLAQLGGTGVFVAALRVAILDGRCELAVHSLKDLPTAAAEGLVIAAVPERED